MTATVSNPLDYTTPIWGVPEKTRPVFDTLFAQGHDAAVIVQDYPAPGLDESKPWYRNDTLSFIAAAKAKGGGAKAVGAGKRGHTGKTSNAGGRKQAKGSRAQAAWKTTGAGGRGANFNLSIVVNQKNIVKRNFIAFFLVQTMYKDLLVFYNFKLLPCYLYNCVHALKN